MRPLECHQSRRCPCWRRSCPASNRGMATSCSDLAEGSRDRRQAQLRSRGGPEGEGRGQGKQGRQLEIRRSVVRGNHQLGHHLSAGRPSRPHRHRRHRSVGGVRGQGRRFPGGPGSAQPAALRAGAHDPIGQAQDGPGPPLSDRRSGAFTRGDLGGDPVRAQGRGRAGAGTAHLGRHRDRSSLLRRRPTAGHPAGRRAGQAERPASAQRAHQRVVRRVPPTRTDCDGTRRSG